MSIIFPLPASSRVAGPFTAVAGQTAFAGNFNIQADADVVVTRLRGTVSTTLALTTDYAVAGVNSPAGFTVTLTTGGLAGDKITLTGQASIDRLTSVALGGSFSSKQLDKELDRNRIIDQEARRDITSLQAADASIIADYTARDAALIADYINRDAIINAKVVTLQNADVSIIADYTGRDAALIADYINRDAIINAKVVTLQNADVSIIADYTGRDAALIADYINRDAIIQTQVSQLYTTAPYMDAKGPLASRSTYNAQAVGFLYLATDATPPVYYMRTGAAGTWAGPYNYSNQIASNADMVAGSDDAKLATPAKIASLTRNIKYYWNVGDTNFTAAFARAFTAVNEVHIPSEEFVANVVVPDKGQIIGLGRYRSKITGPAGVSSTVIAGVNAYSLFGGTSNLLTDGSNNVTIADVTIDGNAANVTGSGDGIAIWGRRTHIENVDIIKVHDIALRTEWTDANEPMEGTFRKIMIDTCGGHGWYCAGPHDLDAGNIIIVDAGGLADNVYYALYVGRNGSTSIGLGRFDNVHTYHRDYVSNRTAYGIYSSYGVNDWKDCHVEGSRRLMRLGDRDKASGMRYYNQFGANGTEMVTFGGNNARIIDSEFNNGYEYKGAFPNGNHEGNGDIYAAYFGNTSGNSISSSVFLGFSLRTPFNFGTSQGLNRIRNCYGYSAGGGATAFAGAVHANDMIDYNQYGTIIDARKPLPFAAYASDAAAGSGGVLSGRIYKNSSTGALTVKA